MVQAHSVSASATKAYRGIQDLPPGKTVADAAPEPIHCTPDSREELQHDLRRVDRLRDSHFPGLEVVFHFTSSFVQQRILENGLRNNPVGPYGGGVHFSSKSPYELGAGGAVYQRKLEHSLMAEEWDKEVFGHRRLNLCVAYAIAPEVLRRAGGSAVAYVPRYFIETMTLPTDSGVRYLRPDRILACIHLEELERASATAAEAAAERAQQRLDRLGSDGTQELAPVLGVDEEEEEDDDEEETEDEGTDAEGGGGGEEESRTGDRKK
eukprot:CAMPEP_0118970486 /NCGR_PEP_ID=MMETSP1173-20130426/7371_1 /TAXON_ID=1034831 /ORGANISM="Rhizochromulina marina cf, Strain CCMP1243" /LENGTH=265 /DNA_ID=CAMNT_0006919857 /DNA_START=209 /DNA_END=1003 /DNA_ORIENTATION=+